MALPGTGTIAETGGQVRQRATWLRSYIPRVGLAAVAITAIAGAMIVGEQLNAVTTLPKVEDTPAPNFVMVVRDGAIFAVPSEIPPSLQAVFQQAANKHGVSVHLVAAIYWKEHGHRFPESAPGGWASSPAGAQGPFQFMPGTWRAYGDDCTGDGRADVQDLTDAACGAARYLAANGAKDVHGTSRAEESKLSRAIFRYNHADWYVASVLRKYRELSGVTDAS